MQTALSDHKYDLLRRRWQLLNRRTNADPAVIDAAVWWIDNEVAEINKTLLG